MTALVSSRKTDQRSDGPLLTKVNVKLAAGATLYSGGMVGLNATGFAVPMGLVAATPRIAGVLIDDHRESITNPGADGDMHRDVSRGIFKFENAGDITQAHQLLPCYAVDDQTVSASSSSNARAKAGTIIEVD